MFQIKTRRDILKFNDGEKFKNYLIRTKPGTDTQSKAIAVGEGGSSEVYLADQVLGEDENVRIKRAIKFFVFRDDIAKDEQAEGRISHDNFKDEIVSISKLSHENIIKVIDGGFENVSGERVPFIVTDFIEGPTLGDLIKDTTVFVRYIQYEEQVIDILVQICKGLLYLHRQKFYHCDIAPKNIFIRSTDTGVQVIIGDLGVGKTLNSQNPTAARLKVIGSKLYMPGTVMRFYGQEISFDEFLKLQPNWDLHSLYLTFRELLNAYERAYVNRKPWYKSLKLTLDDPFVDIEEVAERIMWINPENRKLHGVSELSEADSSAGGSKELQPIRSVWTTERIKLLLRHPAYSRLKYVPQLLSSNTFIPGSNHSRYEHSLGTYEHMRVTLISMLRNESFLGLLSKSNIEMALISSLLVNLSKFPFSFVIDEIQARNKDYFPNLNSVVVLGHLLQYKEEGQKSLLELLKTEFPKVNLDQVKEIVIGKSQAGWPKSLRIVNKLLHSTIDMRVIDFLQRDSYHIGISHGAHINFDSLVKNLRLRNDTIAIDSRGVTDVEQVVTLRYWLYKRIYWNTLNRSYTAVLRHLLLSLQKHKGFESTFSDFVLFSDFSKCFVFLKDQIDRLADVDRSESIKLVSLLETINSGTPRVFRELFLINQSESSSAEFRRVCSEFGGQSCDDIENLRLELERRLTDLFGFRENLVNILIDIPPDEKTKKLGEDLTVIKTNGDEIQIDRMSGIINGISTTFDDTLRFLRVYINPEFENLLADQERRKEAQQIIKKFLLDKMAK